MPITRCFKFTRTLQDCCQILICKMTGLYFGNNIRCLK